MRKESRRDRGRAAGNGVYDRRIVDRTWPGQSVVKLVGTGRVQGTRRRVAVMSLVSRSSYSCVMHVANNCTDPAHWPGTTINSNYGQTGSLIVLRNYDRTSPRTPISARVRPPVCGRPG
jgi:hypothetical protein